MNAVVQCLSNTPKLKDYFLNDSYQTDLNVENPLGFGGLVASEFSLLVYALWLGKFKQISPICFKSTIGKYNEQFLNNDQQDAQEFLLFLLDGLHEDLNRVN
jgi:ubiquitin C-terminal hydrolase